MNYLVWKIEETHFDNQQEKNSIILNYPKSAKNINVAWFQQKLF